MFDIEEFKAQNNMGFTRDSFFYTNIYRPAFWNDDTRFLSFLCSGAQLPGISIIAPDLPRWGYGPTRKFPINVFHPDITLTVYSDGEGKAVDFFHQWNQNVVTYGSLSNPINGSPYGMVQYPINYMTTIELFYMSESGNDQELIRCTLIDAFPLGMGQVSLNWSGRAQISQFIVPINYRTFQIVRNQVDWNTGDIIPRSVIIPDAIYNIDNALSITAGNIGLNGLTSSLSSSLQGILSPVNSIAQRVQMVGGIVQGDVAALNSSISNITGSLNIGF